MIAIYASALEQLVELKGRMAERRRAGEEAAFEAEVSLLAFEVPEPEQGRPADQEPRFARDDGADARRLRRARVPDGERRRDLRQQGASWAQTSFGDKDGWFATAYEYAAKALACQMALPAEQAPGPWRRGHLEAAFAILADLITERPAVARSLLVEVRRAGPRTQAARARTLGALSEAIANSCRRVGPPAWTAPRMAAPFLVAATETIAAQEFADGEEGALRAAIPDLPLMLEEAYSRRPRRGERR